MHDDAAPRGVGRAARSGVTVHVIASSPGAALDPVPSQAADDAAPGASRQVPSTAASAVAPTWSCGAGCRRANRFFDRGDPSTARDAKAARVKRRLDNALAQGHVNEDAKLGRGPGSPVLRTIEAAVSASNVPLNGTASFVFTIDSDGKLVSSVLGDASGGRDAWVRVARETAQALAQKKLAVPKGRSLKLTVNVTSKLVLPSGHDPGVEVDAFGLPIKKGGGPHSTKLDLLNPLHPLSILALEGDPADIGSNARRMGQAPVVSEELL